ncbi:MAG: pyridoxal-phosphate dependent enzyme [Patescibacteria group bacterium]
MKERVFEGPDAILDYLSPGSLGPAPLVELPVSLNPFSREKVKIFIKLMQFVPLANIKSLPSYLMLKRMQAKGVKNLVEYSSGNTVLSLSVLSKHFGIPNLHAIITPDVPEHKKRLLRLVGANILVSHGPPSPDVFSPVGGIADAKKLGRKSGWHNFNQYINPANPGAGRDYLGKELWSQLGRDLSLLVSSIGTGGTILGAGSYLKDRNKKIKVVGVAIKEGSSIPGPRGEGMIDRLGLPWRKATDEVVAINGREAYGGSLELIRSGLFVGPSTGMQYRGLLKKLAEYKRKKSLKSLRNHRGEVLACFVACDTMFPYIDDYFKVLPSKNFSKIKHLK